MGSVTSSEDNLPLRRARRRAASIRILTFRTEYGLGHSYINITPAWSLLPQGYIYIRGKPERNVDIYPILQTAVLWKNKCTHGPQLLHSMACFSFGSIPRIMAGRSWRRFQRSSRPVSSFSGEETAARSSSRLFLTPEFCVPVAPCVVRMRIKSHAHRNYRKLSSTYKEKERSPNKTLKIPCFKYFLFIKQTKNSRVLEGLVFNSSKK